MAVLAFILADVAHEVVGHGIGFLLAGGRSGILTTTRLIETQRLGVSGGIAFDLAGPGGNLACAAAAWILLHRIGTSDFRTGLLLWLTMAFNLFWAFGYLLFGGIFGKGDWLTLVQGWPYPWLCRIGLALAGLLLYRRTISFLGSELSAIHAGQIDGRSFIFTSYMAGGLIACAGAVFDPRGPFEILNSGALSSFGAAVGLLALPGRWSAIARLSPATPVSGRRSVTWIVLAAIAAAIYIAILGPGIHFSL